MRRAAPRLRPEPLEARDVPTTFVVNSLLDGAPAVDGQLTLREAVAAATTNAAAGDAPAGSSTPDTITFAQGLAFGTIGLTQGQLELNGGGDVRIVGPVAGDAAGIAVSGQATGRVFLVTATAGAVRLESLTITRGAAVNLNGGGLFNDGPDTILASVAVTRSSASFVAGGGTGGGIFNAGTLTVNRSVVAGNSATSEGGIPGPGLSGGGIQNNGTLVVNSSRVTGNSASLGGGITNQGTASITRSTVAGNTAALSGGGIANLGTLSVVGCTVSGNLAGADGGGIASGGNGILVVRNSTIALNAADRNGGGLSADAGTTILIHCTVARNAETAGGPGGAGGVHKTAGTLRVVNSVVAQNAAPVGAFDDVDAGDIDAGNVGNFIGGDPELGPLQDNGGPTATMVPLPDSPLVDAGDDEFATETGQSGGVAITTDQRGDRRLIDGDLDAARRVDQGAAEFNPGVSKPIVVGSGPGRVAEVRVFDHDGALVRAFTPYGPNFKGGVRVAVGDVNGDGIDDLVTAPGPGRSPHVRVFHGATGAELANFLAYGSGFKGGVFVAAGDVNGDGKADIITGAGAGRPPRVKVFDSADFSTTLHSFLAYSVNFLGGVSVAAGDRDGDGKADIITGAGAGTRANVKAFRGDDLLTLVGFEPFPPTFRGGLLVAAGDVDGDGKADIIVSQASGGSRVKVIGDEFGEILLSFHPYARSFTGGVRVAAADLDGDGFADIITAPGPGASPHVRVRNLMTTTSFDFFPFELDFLGGVYVAG